MTDNPDTTSAQQVLLVLDALSAAGCRSWIGGGWGVDALVGRQTRPHRDLDLALDAGGLEAGLKALAALGYAVETDWLPVRVEVHCPGHGWVDIHPVVFDDAGAGVQSGFDGEVFHYPPTSFTRGRIGDRPVPCLSVEWQLEFHQGYELRPVDHHDLTLLRQQR